MFSKLHQFLGACVFVLLIVTAGSLISAFAKLADARGYIKPAIGQHDGRVVLGHRIGPDGNLNLVYKN